MLSVEDQNVLGLNRVRKPSSVSQALRSISEEIHAQPAPAEKGRSNYRILVASNRALRSRRARLEATRMR